MKGLSSSADLSVTVVGVRTGWDDAECQEHVILLDVIEGLSDSVDEEVFVFDDIVGRHYDELCLWVALEQGICGKCCTWRSVS